MNACMRHRHPGAPRGMRGVGLIEVLVAVAILAFGLLGIAALQATALRNGESSYERSQAVTMSYTILDRMRANIDQARIGNYNIPRTCDAPATGDQIANDLHDWVTNLHNVLGESACGTITCKNNVLTRQCDIVVDWDDSRGTQGNAKQELKMSTAL